MKQRIYKLLMKLSSWKIEGTLPKDKKLIICVAPHTSNWDFLIGKIAYGSLGKKTSFLIKKEWVDNILVGWWLKLHGAIGVARDKKTSLTDKLAEQIKKAKELHLAITPEGTRKANPDWKMGFYHIAKKAEVPILIVGLDFKERKAKILDLFKPTGNEALDIKYIKEKYLGITAKYPELFDLGLA